MGASCRAAAQCAKRTGRPIVAIDLFGDRDLFEAARTYVVDRLDAAADLCTQTSSNPAISQSEGIESQSPTVDGLLLAGGMENCPDVVDSLIARGYVAGASGVCIRELRNLNNWMRWSVQAMLPMPTTRISPALCGQDSADIPVSSNAPAESMPSQTERWLIKSCSSAGGLGVMSESDVCIESNRSFAVPNMHYLQRYVHGISMGVTFLATGRETLVVGVTESWGDKDAWGPTEFIYRGNVGPVVPSAIIYDRLVQFGTRVANETGVRGLWQADFVVDGDEWYLLEINPRWTAGMEVIDLCSPISLIEVHFKCIHARETFDITPSQREQLTAACDPNAKGNNASDLSDGVSSKSTSRVRPMVGKLVVYADHDVVPTQEILEHWWSQRWDGNHNQLSTKTYLADIPNSTSPIPRGQPILTCMTGGADRDAILGRLNLVANFIRDSLRS